MNRRNHLSVQRWFLDKHSKREEEQRSIWWASTLIISTFTRCTLHWTKNQKFKLTLIKSRFIAHKFNLHFWSFAVGSWHSEIILWLHRATYDLFARDLVLSKLKSTHRPRDRLSLITVEASLPDIVSILSKSSRGTINPSAGVPELWVACNSCNFKNNFRLSFHQFSLNFSISSNNKSLVNHYSNFWIISARFPYFHKLIHNNNTENHDNPTRLQSNPPMQYHFGTHDARTLLPEIHFLRTLLSVCRDDPALPCPALCVLLWTEIVLILIVRDKMMSRQHKHKLTTRFIYKRVYMVCWCRYTYTLIRGESENKCDRGKSLYKSKHSIQPTK